MHYAFLHALRGGNERYRIYRIYGLLIIYVSASDMINEMIFISILSNE